MKVKKKSLFNQVFDIAIVTILVVLALVTLYPLYFTVIASVSDPFAVAKGEVILWVKEFTLEPYKNVFLNKEIWVGYRNSIINTAILVMISLCTIIPAAFVMSRAKLKRMGLLSNFFIITMYFSGGMVPMYLLVKELGLLDSRWALILPFCFNAYNMIIAKSSMQNSVPEELYDAARIDGCNTFGMFFKIALPLSKAIIAVIALYTAVASWSSWFDAMLYISDKDLYPLQLVLRSILIQNEQMKVIATSGMDAALIESASRRAYMAEAMKYSLIFISSAPMLIAYPFVQKYFVKGTMIGAVKS